MVNSHNEFPNSNGTVIILNLAILNMSSITGTKSASHPVLGYIDTSQENITGAKEVLLVFVRMKADEIATKDAIE
jgi:hypothetical protein